MKITRDDVNQAVDFDIVSFIHSFLHLDRGLDAVEIDISFDSFKNHWMNSSLPSIFLLEDLLGPSLLTVINQSILSLLNIPIISPEMTQLVLRWFDNNENLSCLYFQTLWNICLIYCLYIMNKYTKDGLHIISLPIDSLFELRLAVTRLQVLDERLCDDARFVHSSFMTSHHHHFHSKKHPKALNGFISSESYDTRSQGSRGHRILSKDTRRSRRFLLIFFSDDQRFHLRYSRIKFKNIQSSPTFSTFEIIVCDLSRE